MSGAASCYKVQNESSVCHQNHIIGVLRTYKPVSRLLHRSARVCVCLCVLVNVLAGSEVIFDVSFLDSLLLVCN